MKNVFGKLKNKILSTISVLALASTVLLTGCEFDAEFNIEGTSVKSEAAVESEEAVESEAAVESEDEDESVAENSSIDETVQTSKETSIDETSQASKTTSIDDTTQASKETSEETKTQEIAYSFRNKKLLNQHYEKHGKDMGFASAREYEEAASEVINNPEALNKIEAEDGDYVYYVEKTNEFVILSKDGYIRTYFLPDSGKKYYDKQ